MVVNLTIDPKRNDESGRISETNYLDLRTKFVLPATSIHDATLGLAQDDEVVAQCSGSRFVDF